MPNYQPPYTLNNRILSLVAKISEAVGCLSAEHEQTQLLRLCKVNRIRSVQGSLAIEGNTLSEEQITAILDGKRVIAPPKEVQEAHNAIAVYDVMHRWQAANGDDLLAAHRLLMKGLAEDAGIYRHQGVGVMSGDKVVHMAPQAERVPKLMQELLLWLSYTDVHPLIASCVFHYEFEFIHPFSDGNGRMGRLWQTLILSKWHEVFVNVPVESMVHQHQQEYYEAIGKSTAQADCASFVEFMLQMILAAISQSVQLNTGIDGVNDGVNDGVKLSAIQQKILYQIARAPDITREQLAPMMNKSVRTIERHISVLKAHGLIERIGSDKTGYWHVIERV